MGGGAGSPQCLYEKALGLDKLEAQLTWANVAWVQGVIARGGARLLVQFVRDPEGSIDNSGDTMFFGQTALWIKLRSEGQLVFSSDEKAGSPRPRPLRLTRM